MKDNCSRLPPVGRMIIDFFSESEKNVDLVKTNVAQQEDGSWVFHFQQSQGPKGGASGFSPLSV